MASLRFYLVQVTLRYVQCYMDIANHVYNDAVGHVGSLYPKSTKQGN